MTKAKLSGILTIDQIARLLDLPSWDMLNVHGTDEEEQEAYKTWSSAVMHAANQLFEDHSLTFEPRGVDWRVVPATKMNWRDALAKIVTTINGYGLFTIESVKDLIDAGPYVSAREAVLNHLSWIKERPKVYGMPSAKRLYEQRLR